MTNKIVYSGHRTVPLRWVLAGVGGAALLILIVGLTAGLIRPSCPDKTLTTPVAPNFTVPTRAPTSTPDPSKPWLVMRLPKYQMPTQYRVRLHPRLGAESNQGFTGEVDISLKLLQPAKHILVHVKYLSVTETAVFKTDKTELKVARSFNYTENQFWVIEMESEVSGNTDVVVKLKFKGYYYGIVGLYQSTYMENGVQKYLATTKFEPTDARKAFPCLDEPQLKAAFIVELVHGKNYSALSNMPTQGQENYANDLLLTTFQPTKNMSTYLFCILISEFASLNLTSSGGNPFRVWAAPSYISQANYSLFSGKRVQDYFGELLNYSYDEMFPKQDMAAIPDFPSGAMEHWGLITYRDTSMLFDDTQGSAGNKQGVLNIVAHELAHMWFGNLVTMVWWNDLWLNEGFASYFASIGASQIEPDWALIDQSIVSTYTSAFNADDVITSHPIIVDVATPQEITQIFDTITYSKGQAVLTQLENFIGQKKFFDGLAHYLRNNQYGVASAKQLYASIQQFTSENVTEFMDSWTLQMGFPLVTVRGDSSSDNIVVNQTWFLRDPSTRNKAPPSPFGYKWVIKLTYNVSGSSNASAIVRDSQTVVNVPGYATMYPPLKFNFGQMGFYRVNYPDSWWERIAEALKNNVNSYPTVDRAGLIGDAFAIAQSNQLSYATVVKLLDYMKSESEYLAWVTANSGLNTISRMLARRATFGEWSNFGNKITESIYSRIGWGNQGNHLNRLLQPIVLNLACRFGNLNCISEAKRQFNDWKNNDKSINAELRQIVYTYGLMEDDTQKTWDFMWQKYRDSNFAAEKERLLRALAMTKNSWLIYRLLDFSLDRKLVRSQDFVTVIGYIGANPNALEILWSWCRDKWEQLLKEFGPEDRRLGAMIPGFASQFNDEFHLTEYKAFISSTQPGAGANARQTTLQVIQNNIQWLSLNEENLIKSLK